MNGFIILLASIASLPAIGQDADDFVKRMLSSRAFPWYEAETDDARLVPLRERPKPRSSDRDSIPRRKKSDVQLPSNYESVNQTFNLMFWVVFGVLLACIVGLLVWAYMRLESNKRHSMNGWSRRSLADSIEHLPFQVDATGDFLAAARQAYQAGDYRKATIYLYSHVLVTLDQSNLIRLRKGRTNRQYLRDLSRRTSLAGYFENVMESFESVFFGDHEISKTDFESAWNRYSVFEDEIKKGLVSPEGGAN